MIDSLLEADELKLLRTVANATMDFVRLLVDTTYQLDINSDE